MGIVHALGGSLDCVASSTTLGAMLSGMFQDLLMLWNDYLKDSQGWEAEGGSFMLQILHQFNRSVLIAIPVSKTYQTD